MLRPLALTAIFALAGSMLFSLTMLPILETLLPRIQDQLRESWLTRVAKQCYAPVLRLAVRYKSPVGPLRIDLGFKLHRDPLPQGGREGVL